MPNKDIFTGSDASLVLAVDDNTVEEGKIADGLLSEYELSSVVGELKEVQVMVETEIRPYHAIGSRHASQLRTGNIPDNGSKLVLFGVKFKSWNFSIPEDDFVMEHVTFQALRISQEDSGN